MAGIVETLLAQLSELKLEAEAKIHAVKSEAEVQQLRTLYLGKKGKVSEVLKSLKNVDGKDRPRIGQEANVLRDFLEAELTIGLSRLEAARIRSDIDKESIDVTLPGTRFHNGALHPLAQVRDRIIDIFAAIGFSVVDGPEVETDFCNFEALNVPANHPARDMQDTLYVRENIVLRTQTSSVQIRTMMAEEPPIKVIAPGAVYRNDDVDATHSPMFHQVEGLYVDENVSLEELKGTLEYFAKEMFGPKTKIRLRNSYFPFTEPSVEVDCTCIFCKGNGCRICKQTGWIEILGAGMVHPSLFEKIGYPEGKYTGFAFGMGIERVAMLLYGIDDIRLFYENDIRFLEQFQ